MTTEGLENLKKVMRKAIELQTDAVVVMSVLQRIYCDEEDELDKDASEHLRSAVTSARVLLDFAISTTNSVRKAFDIEKAMAVLEDKLDNEQDNGKE